MLEAAIATMTRMGGAPPSGSLDVDVDPSQTPRRPRSTARRDGYWWTDERLVAGVDFGMATGIDAFDGAFRLVHDQYVARGFMAPQESGRRLSIHNSLTSTKVFVARRQGVVIGTLTLIEDSFLGLPMGEIYEEELAGLRARGHRLAEVSALALDPRYRAVGVAIVMRLVRMLVLYAAQVEGLDELCIAVNPRHVDFYRRLLQFQVFGDVKSYQKVNGAPAVALRLELALPRAIIADLRAGERRSELYEFLFGHWNHARTVIRLHDDLPRSCLAPEDFAVFMLQPGTVVSMRTAVPLGSVTAATREGEIGRSALPR